MFDVHQLSMDWTEDTSVWLDKLNPTSASSEWKKKNPASVELQDIRGSVKSSFESRGVEFLDHDSFKSRCLHLKSAVRSQF